MFQGPAHLPARRLVLDDDALRQGISNGRGGRRRTIAVQREGPRGDREGPGRDRGRGAHRRHARHRLRWRAQPQVRSSRPAEVSLGCPLCRHRLDQRRRRRMQKRQDAPRRNRSTRARFRYRRAHPGRRSPTHRTSRSPGRTDADIDRPGVRRLQDDRARVDSASDPHASDLARFLRRGLCGRPPVQDRRPRAGRQDGVRGLD